jgi:heme exporter protein D
MENWDFIKIGKYTFFTSLAVGTYLLVGFALTENDLFVTGGIFYLPIAFSVNLLILISLLVFSILWKKKRKECFIGIGFLLINIPVAVFYFWVIIKYL